MWPLGRASTREPSAARRVGTITTTSPSRTTTPPAENSRACAPPSPVVCLARLAPPACLGDRLRRGSEDILLEGLRVVDGQAPAPLGNDPGALEHGEEAT